MTVSLRIKDGLVKRLREIHLIRSEEALARLIGCDRMTLRRIENGAQPSGGFIAQFCDAFQLGIGEAFEIVKSDAVADVASAGVEPTTARDDEAA